MKMHSVVRPRGFALIATLMIIGVLAILVTAFVIAMRTERAASSNFVERERAQAIANGMLHRLIADQSSPYIETTGTFLGPFQTDSNTQLPIETSSNTYLADQTKAGNVPMLNQIFTMPPSPGISSSNHLVRISGTSATNSTAKWAYNPAYWGYARQNPDPAVHAGYFNYYPLDNNQTPIAPDWVDYYDTTGKKIGQVAYTVWDEAGKIDIDMAGPDGIVPTTASSTNITLIAGRLNGLAPHDLKFEYLVGPLEEQGLLDYLNGDDTLRERNNFSLRAIVPSTYTNPPAANNTGDDRSIFSVEELLNRKDASEQPLVGNEYAQDMLDVTTMSRDFEVRPEWNGDRSPTVAVNYLKSYVNNPALFTLFGSANSQGRPQMISHFNPVNPLDATGIDAALKSANIPLTDDWRQVGRLLAILRLALPPGTSYIRTTAQLHMGGNPAGVENESQPAEAALWDDQDVYAIALNLLQASDPANDEELSAFDRQSNQNLPYNDPELRVGMRLSPYMVETALKATRQNTGLVQLVEYQKIWNPYPVCLNNDGVHGIDYRYGPSWSGGYWPLQAGTATGSGCVVDGMFNNGDGADANAQTTGNNITNTTPPDLEGSNTPFDTNSQGGNFQPNSFTIVKHSRLVQLAMGHDLVMFTRPWIYNANYFSVHNTSLTPNGDPQSFAYAFTGGPLPGLPFPGFNSGITNTVYMGLFYVIPASGLKTNGAVNWFSYQIDDPRMGTMARYTTTPPNQNSATNNAGTNNTVILTQNIPLISSSTSQPENPVTTKLYSILNPTTGSTAINSINYTPMYYSWQPLPAHQTLYSTASGFISPDPVAQNPSVTFKSLLPGCNYNFLTLVDQPKSWTGMTDTQKYHAAMATFALPGHPFSNLGEIATVFANRPWTTLSMAQNLPLSNGTAGGTTGGTSTNPTALNAKLALLLDYYTTLGTTTNPTDSSSVLGKGGNMLMYTGTATYASQSAVITSSTAARAQDHIWLFEKQTPTAPDGNLRPIRGRINLNTASQDVLMRLLCGQGASSKSSDPLSPYFLVPSVGNTPTKNLNIADARVMQINSVNVTQAQAQAIANDIIAIRPLRKISDLVLGGSDGMGLNSPKLEGGSSSTFQKLQTDTRGAFDPTGTYYTGYLADAILGRLAELGTVRSQAYTVDMVARATKTMPGGQTVTTGEVRMLAHVYLDTFSRQAFVQSVEYR